MTKRVTKEHGRADHRWWHYLWVHRTHVLRRDPVDLTPRMEELHERCLRCGWVRVTERRWVRP